MTDIRNKQNKVPNNDPQMIESDAVSILRESQHIAHIGSWRLKIETNELNWTDELVFLYGVDKAPETVEGFLECVHPDDREKIQDQIGEALKEKTGFEYDYRIIRPDGEVRIHHAIGKVYTDESGKPQYLYGTSQDVTELRQKEQDLVKFREAVEYATDGVVITDKDFAVQYINPSFAELSGWKFEEVEGKNANECFLSDSVSDELRMELQKKLLAGESFTSSDVIIKKNEVPVRLSIYPTKTEGGHTFFVALTHDVTEQKQLEQRKNEFLSIASHQLRTPLGSMRWNLDMIKEYEDELPEPARESFQEAQKSTARLIKLVGDLLNIARIEQGRTKNSPEQADLRTIIENTVAELKGIAEEEGIDMVMAVPTGFPFVVIDKQQFREVVQNLLTNALKYTPDGGKVTMGGKKREGDMLFWVTDTGMGILKDDYDKMFTKFFRSEKASGSDPSGSGLGLAIVKSYVENWGGEIWFDSVEGEGTEFYFTVPLKAPEREEVKDD